MDHGLRSPVGIGAPHPFGERQPVVLERGERLGGGYQTCLGRLSLPLAPWDYLPRHLELNAVARLPIAEAHGYRAAALPPHHADPFDRMLVAQAQSEDMVVLSADPLIRRYDVEVVW